VQKIKKFKYYLNHINIGRHTMCESRLYLVEGEEKKEIMEEAVLVKEKDSRVIAVGLLGQREDIEGARIVEVDADRHTITIRRD